MATAPDIDIERLQEVIERYYGLMAERQLKIMKRAGYSFPTVQPEIRCECGAESCGHPGHSRWCPKAEK